MNGLVGLFLIGPAIVKILLNIQGLYIKSRVYRNLVFLGMSNCVPGAIALLFILLALAALLHLAVWPILERPIYSLQRFAVARNPKLVGATAVTCLLFAWPNSFVIQAITKLLHG